MNENLKVFGGFAGFAVIYTFAQNNVLSQFEENTQFSSKNAPWSSQNKRKHNYVIFHLGSEVIAFQTKVDSVGARTEHSVK